MTWAGGSFSRLPALIVELSLCILRPGCLRRSTWWFPYLSVDQGIRLNGSTAIEFSMNVEGSCAFHIPYSRVVLELVLTTRSGTIENVVASMASSEYWGKS
ncbi:hypothetical protein BD413DRAFT_564413 [Trametes elegans]|nr:hypothetical protein BD413DRAFT_564413 [Trametes elegans]